MEFRDRREAGQQLAVALKAYADAPDTIVIALPRGGVVVGYEVAQALHLPLDITCPRKIGAPFNPELAIGAITETGECILSEGIIEELGVPRQFIDQAIEREKRVAQERLEHYRAGRPPRDLAGKTVIIVDDGLATGSTMRAAIRSLRRENPSKLIMAIPVAPPDTLHRLSSEVDQTVCLFSPSSFFAVGQFYVHFDQTLDPEVIQLLVSDTIRH